MPTDHMCLRKDPVILLAPLKVMPQNHKKHHLLTFLHPNRCPKDHMAKSKYSEIPSLPLTNLVQTAM